MRAKMKYICKKFINHQIKKCFLFRCRHAVVIMQTLNWTNQCPLFMTVRHIFEISEDDHPSLVTHARDNWWTLDFANVFVSPGVNSRGELVPSHGASRRRLGTNSETLCWSIEHMMTLCTFSKAVSVVWPARYADCRVGYIFENLMCSSCLVTYSSFRQFRNKLEITYRY
jgi:hypothetical protein